jgi:lipopolysaccharide/colanic/teichoic acid biosynthesis glycosyltransferase
MIITKYKTQQNQRTVPTFIERKVNLNPKRIFDFTFSIIVLILLSPIFLIIAILIKLKSPNGNIFFGHQRVGKDKKLFKIYKFRTMVPDAEDKLKNLLNQNPKIKAEFDKDFKLQNDPRIIPGIGNFLRKTSLDELPQFFNSLIGNLSVVGPRPIVTDEIKKYGKYIEKLHSVKPGITGLWQVSGRNNISYDERVSFDMKYIEQQSLWIDIKIVLKTIKVMIFREGV